MIKEITIRDFFAFNGEHTITLNPKVNILLGINGSGKTSFINAFEFLFQGVCGIGLTDLIRQWGSYRSIVNARGETRPDCFSLTYVFDAEALKKKFPLSPFNSDVHYKITVFPVGDGSNYSICESLFKLQKGSYTFLEFRNGIGEISARNEDGVHKEKYTEGLISAQELALRQITDPQRYLPSFIIREAIASMAIYRKFNIELVRQPSDANTVKRLIPSGENLAYLYNNIQNNHTLAYEKLVQNLNGINQNYTGIGFNYFGSRLYLYLRERNLAHTIDTLHVSDGTLKFMLLMGILLNPDRGNLVAIDEPESYLHPDMIRAVTKMLKSAAQQSQLIIATHSPLLLNAFTLNDLIVFQKDASNDTKVLSGSKVFEGSDTDLLPGQLWLNGELGGMRW